MITFKDHMKEIEPIVVPEVHPQLTTRRVIVTSWIDGVKLSSCKSEDVLELCDALLNCYLHQLMGTGFLHAGARFPVLHLEMLSWNGCREAHIRY